MQVARSSVLAAGALFATLIAVSTAGAQTAVELTTVRQGIMRSFNAHVQVATAVGKGEIANAKLVEASALAINTIAKQLPAMFPRGSGTESGQRTRAKPEIWSQADAFKAAAARLDVESAKLQTVAATGDVAAIAAQVTALNANACNACHGSFRAPAAP